MKSTIEKPKTFYSRERASEICIRLNSEPENTWVFKPREVSSGLYLIDVIDEHGEELGTL